MAKRGRPTDYKPEIVEAICERLATGESLRTICDDPNLPDTSTVYRWLARADRDDFRDQYARARETQAHFYAAEIIEIADDSSGDYVQRENSDGSTYEAVDHDHIARSRLRVDARKWYASKVAPKIYGDRIQTELTGANGAPLTATVILTGRPEPTSSS